MNNGNKVAWNFLGSGLMDMNEFNLVETEHHLTSLENCVLIPSGNRIHNQNCEEERS
jgi:hypothetical protein